MNFAEFHERVRIAVDAMQKQTALNAAVAAEVDAFFARYPGIARTEATAGFIASLIRDRLSAQSSTEAAA